MQSSTLTLAPRLMSVHVGMTAQIFTQWRLRWTPSSPSGGARSGIVPLTPLLPVGHGTACHTRHIVSHSTQRLLFGPNPYINICWSVCCCMGDISAAAALRASGEAAPYCPSTPRMYAGRSTWEMGSLLLRSASRASSWPAP